MNQFLTRILSRRKGPVAGAEVDYWRRVPKIDLVTRTQTRRTSPLIVAGLVLVVLVEVLFIQNIYRERTANQEGAEELKTELQRAQGREDQIAEAVSGLSDQITALKARRGATGLWRGDRKACPVGQFTLLAL